MDEEKIKRLIKDSIVLEIDSKNDVLVFFVDGLTNGEEIDLGKYLNDFIGIKSIIMPKGGEIKLIKVKDQPKIPEILEL